MIRRRTAAVLLGISIVGGVAAGVAADAMTSETPAKEAKPRASTTTPTSQVKTGVEVKDPVLVSNDDGGATLSATLLNHTDAAVTINSATGGRADDYDAPVMLVYGTRSRVSLAPGDAVRIGGMGDSFRLRFADRVQVGSTLPVTISFQGAGPRFEPNPPKTTIIAPVVARTAKRADVANNGPNDEITVRDATIVVVPGQAKAYVAGYLESSITDMAEMRPTATRSKGQPIEYLHQTATGGPYGIFTQPGQKTYLSRPPYLETDPQGDADYFRASDVEIGEKITVTMRFPSGDVVTKFKVVQGRADGTIAS
jgi:hypothetical protein